MNSKRYQNLIQCILLLISIPAIFALVIFRSGRCILRRDLTSVVLFAVVTIVGVLFITDQAFEYAKIKAIVVYVLAATIKSVGDYEARAES